MKKIKVGYTWKHHEGLSKGKEFKVKEVTADSVIYVSLTSDQMYSKPRKEFEKYIERVNKHWHDVNKRYKNKKNDMKGE